MRLPISVKGVLIHRGRVLVLRNGRGEWELPGGRLDDGETPEKALTREIREETGLTASRRFSRGRLGVRGDAGKEGAGPGVRLSAEGQGRRDDQSRAHRTRLAALAT